MNGFTMILPPDWTMIDLQGDRRSGVRTVVNGWLSGVAPHQASVARPVLLTSLERMTADMAGKGIAAVVMQSTGLNEIGVHPTMVVRELDIPPEIEPLDLLIAMAGGDSSAQVLDLNHLVGLRTRDTERVERDIEAGVGAFPPELGVRAAGMLADSDGLRQRIARRTRYVMGQPDDRFRWVELLATVEVADDDEGAALASAYEELFDALAGTFDWRI